MYFEELQVGQTFKLEPITISENEIISFAKEYDPQPIHVDEDFANQSIFKGIIASGLQTVALVWKKWIDAGIHGKEIVGGKGIDELRWKTPVYPEDTLHTKVEVIEKQLSSKGGRGTVTFEFLIYNQRDELTTTFKVSAILKSLEK